MIFKKFKVGDYVKEIITPDLKLLVREYEINRMGMALKSIMGYSGNPTPEETEIVICEYNDPITQKLKTKKRHQDKLELWT